MTTHNMLEQLNTGESSYHRTRLNKKGQGDCMKKITTSTDIRLRSVQNIKDTI